MRIVELARILAGPWAGQTLADLGAQVVKIESPAGDDTRRWGPPFVGYEGGGQDAAYFHAANRGKSSVIIDFTTSEGHAKLMSLISEADVLIENFKVGGLARYGLDYTTLAKSYPGLIYCSITGFGQTGPYAQRAGYDFIVQGLSGIMDLTGEPDGPPEKIGVAYADIMTGLYSVIGIQAALAERTRSGLGQHIDMSLLDVMVGTLANQAMNQLASGVCPHRIGNAHPNIAPYETFATDDSWIIITVGNDDQFARLCDVLGVTSMPEFSTNAARVAARTQLRSLLAPAIARRSRDELLAVLTDRGVPAAPVNTVEDAFADPQVISRGLEMRLSGPTSTPIPSVALPIKFSRSPLATPVRSPRLGEMPEVI